MENHPEPSEATPLGNGQIDFADPTALGTHLIKRLEHFGAMESIVPGLTVEWALEVGNKAFVFKIRVMSPGEIS